jgi:hypothetical protein
VRVYYIAGHQSHPIARPNVFKRPRSPHIIPLMYLLLKLSPPHTTLLRDNISSYRWFCCQLCTYYTPVRLTPPSCCRTSPFPRLFLACEWPSTQWLVHFGPKPSMGGRANFDTTNYPVSHLRKKKYSQSILYKK